MASLVRGHGPYQVENLTAQLAASDARKHRRKFQAFGCLNERVERRRRGDAGLFNSIGLRIRQALEKKEIGVRKAKASAYSLLALIRFEPRSYF